jgi:hypothetical protein
LKRRFGFERQLHRHRGGYPFAVSEPPARRMRSRGPGCQLSQDETHIYAEERKTDRIDAEKLARLAKLAPKLLTPIEHRGEYFQAHQALIRSREALVRTKARLIKYVRFEIKFFG